MFKTWSSQQRIRFKLEEEEESRGYRGTTCVSIPHSVWQATEASRSSPALSVPSGWLAGWLVGDTHTNTHIATPILPSFSSLSLSLSVRGYFVRWCGQYFSRSLAHSPSVPFSSSTVPLYHIFLSSCDVMLEETLILMWIQECYIFVQENGEMILDMPVKS